MCKQIIAISAIGRIDIYSLTTTLTYLIFVIFLHPHILTSYKKSRRDEISYKKSRRDISWTARSIAQMKVLFPTLQEKNYLFFFFFRGPKICPNPRLFPTYIGPRKNLKRTVMSTICSQTHPEKHFLAHFFNFGHEGAPNVTKRIPMRPVLSVWSVLSVASPS